MSEQYVQVPVSLIERIVLEVKDGFTVDELRALLSQPTPIAEPPRGIYLAEEYNRGYADGVASQLSTKPDRESCAAETYSWDHFRPEQVDAYWITCDVIGLHDEHEDEHTGLTWRDPSTIRDVTAPKDAA